MPPNERLAIISIMPGIPFGKIKNSVDKIWDHKIVA
jgi:hypothetical protein